MRGDATASQKPMIDAFRRIKRAVSTTSGWPLACPNVTIRPGSAIAAKLRLKTSPPNWLQDDIRALAAGEHAYALRQVYRRVIYNRGRSQGR